MKKHKWLTPAAFILLAAATVFAVSRQSRTFTAEGFMDYAASLHPWGLPCAAVLTLCYILAEGLCLLNLCQIMGYKRNLFHGIQYSAADLYFSAITPSATGGQPASALLMIKDGIPGAVTTVVLLINLALYNAALFAVFAFSFILYPGVFRIFDVPAQILIILGAFFHALLMAGIILLVFNERLFLKITDLFLRLGQRLRLFRGAEERRKKLVQVEKDYRESAGTLGRHLPRIFSAFAFSLLQRISITLVPTVLYAASGGCIQDSRKLFSIQMLAVMGSNSVPIPGAVGVADYLFLNGYASLLPDPVNLELLARTVSFYMCVLVCALIVLIRFLVQKNTSGKTNY